MKRLPMTPDNYWLVCGGGKTVTRRLINPQPPVAGYRPDGYLFEKKPRYRSGEIVLMVTRWAVSDLYDQLKPKELRSDIRVWVPGAGGKFVPLGVRLDSYHCSLLGKWRPARFLPLPLEYQFPQVEILSARAERLHDITEEDAIREGISETPREPGFDCWSTPGIRGYYSTPRCAFVALWDSIHKKHQWAANPWVFRYEFEVA